MCFFGLTAQPGTNNQPTNTQLTQSVQLGISISVHLTFYKECDQKVLSAKKIETKTCDILKAVHTKGGGGHILRTTHLSVGITAALAVLQPDNLYECLAVTGIAAVGSVISDIDADQSKVRREADFMLGVGAAILATIMIVQTKFHVDFTKYLSGNQTLSERSVAAGVFMILCVIGRMTPHRSFMHSLAAGVIFTMVIYTMFSKQAALAFMIAFLTHILLDLLNCKGIQLFWPVPGHHCFKLCASNGWVNRILCLTGTVLAINLFTGFAGISIVN